MEQYIEKELKEVIGDLTCRKNFKCCTEGLETLCKAQDVGLETFLECLEEHPPDCPFSLSFGDMFLCECPLRGYIAKKSGK